MRNTFLLDGMVWAAMWMAVNCVLITKYPMVKIRDYPKSIQQSATFVPTDIASLSAFIFPARIPLLGFLPGITLYRFMAVISPVWEVMAYMLLVYMVWNVIDLVVLDWLLFCTIKPQFMTFPGTAGCVGYGDYRFHLVSFLKSCLLAVIVSVVAGGALYILLKLAIWK